MARAGKSEPEAGRRRAGAGNARKKGGHRPIRSAAEGKAVGLGYREGHIRAHNQNLSEAEALGVDVEGLTVLEENPDINPLTPGREETNRAFVTRALRERAPNIVQAIDAHLQGQPVRDRDGNQVALDPANPRVLEMCLNFLVGKPGQTMAHELTDGTKELLESLRDSVIPVPVLTTGMVVTEEVEGEIVREEVL